MEISNIKYQISNIQRKVQDLQFWFVVLILGFWIFNFNCYAQVISSDELISRAKEYDGKTVVYQGEVIGEVMTRGQGAWINVQDSQAAIGVWLPLVLARGVSQTGSYKFKGDMVEVSGVFQRACPEHGADLDIHAQSLRKVQAGYPLKEKVSPDKIKAAQVFAVILGLSWILVLLKRL
jgi:hypothetical protein